MFNFKAFSIFSFQDCFLSLWQIHWKSINTLNYIKHAIWFFSQSSKLFFLLQYYLLNYFFNYYFYISPESCLIWEVNNGTQSALCTLLLKKLNRCYFETHKIYQIQILKMLFGKMTSKLLCQKVYKDGFSQQSLI